MERPDFKRAKKHVVQVWDLLRARAVAAPKEFWVAGSLCALVVLLVGLHTAFSQKDAILRVRVQHSFRSAQLTVLVDNDSAFSCKLTGSAHKKFGFLSDGVQGTWSQGIPVSAGRHRVSVRVVGDDGSDHVDNTAARFEKGSERELLVVARHSDLNATWQGGGNSISAGPIPSTPISEPSWLSRYASTLMLTVAGSIVSALSGYAIREIPARLRSRTIEEKAAPRRAAAAGR